jgi:hypothetical protein
MMTEEEILALVEFWTETLQVPEACACGTNCFAAWRATLGNPW